MNEQIERFVEGLRDELKQYGAFLALLDSQQQQVIRRLADELLVTVSAIQAQCEAIRAARGERAQRQRHLADSLQLSPESPIRTLVAAVPAVYRPLITALVEENNRLLQQVQQRARQNHILLSRGVELMTQFLNSVYGIGQPTYNEAGAVAPAARSGRPLYEEVC